MKPPWAGKRRDANEQEIVDALRGVGAHVERLHVICDLLVIYRGDFDLVEVKNQSGLTPKQRLLLDMCPNLFTVVETSEGALRLIGAIT